MPFKITPNITVNAPSIISVDCKWSAWGQWSKCSKSCGIGSQQERIRAIATTAKNGGNECVGSNKAIRLCNKGKCPRGINGHFMFNSKFYSKPNYGFTGHANY